MPKSLTPKPAGRGRPEMSSAQREEMKLRISQAAKALFQEQGYAKISLRRIAKEIGCTPMTIYGYYPSKFDILRTLWGDVFKTLFDHLNSIENDGNPQTRLQSLCAAYVNFWINNPDYYRLVFMAEGVTQPDVSLFLDNPEIVAKYTLFLQALHHLQPQNEGQDAKAKLDFLLSAMHGVAHNKITISGYDWSSCDAQIGYAIKGIS
ncbi:MAG: TetR/AcrR family transcriptional regulator [Hellea sp.]